MTGQARWIVAGVLAVTVVLGLVIALAASRDTGAGPVTPERYQAAVADMREMIRLTEAGDVAAGEEAFWRAHPFLHDVDPPLRRRHPELARQLWDAMILLETAYATDAGPEDLLRHGRNVLRLLEEAGPVLELVP
ncbi:MAG: hypothetical protein FWJ62_07625 [Thermaerobacter sp.]